jgi:hypothetical protein
LDATYGTDDRLGSMAPGPMEKGIPRARWLGAQVHDLFAGEFDDVYIW